MLFLGKLLYDYCMCAIHVQIVNWFNEKWFDSIQYLIMLLDKKRVQPHKLICKKEVYANSVTQF